MQADQSPASAPARRRGRPRSFDPDAAAAAALRTLWAKGYEATTVEELTAAMGLNPSSLYAAFGSKHGVLAAALERYDRDRDELLAPLEHGSAGLADVCRFLAGVRASVVEPGGAGCFMVNTATEVAPRSAQVAERTGRYRQRVRDAIAAALARAAALGEIEPGTESDQARIVQSCVYGALVAARGGADAEAVAAIDALERQIRAWAQQRKGAGSPPAGRSPRDEDARRARSHP